MSISGPEALSSLEEALRDIRREEDEISKRLARSAERIAKFRENEGELLRQLAMVRLDPATQAQLDKTISQAEAQARDMIKRHAGELASTEDALKTLDAAIAQLTQDRAAALAVVDKRQAELKALSAKIATAIAKDPAYAQKRKEASDLQVVAAESLRKTQQAEADREQKGRPYRDDPLFMYLWNRGYGTRNYQSNNLFRWLDGKVASLIGFNGARPNFAMLNELPLRLREHAERQAANAAAAEKEVDDLENRAIDAAGGQPVREAIEKAQASIAEIDGKIVAAEDDRDERAKAMRQLAQGADPAFERAISAFAEGLGREDIQSLLAEARRTATAQDDAIIAQIDDIRVRVREEDAETADQKERLKTLATRRRELEDISYEFKKQRYDDPRSTFREDKLVGDLLNDFLRGGIAAATYWDLWRRSQNWSSGTSDWGGGYGLPRNGRNPWPDSGGGFNWPDNSFGGGSSRGGSSGGGFGGGWGGGSSGGGGFSRPRTGSAGTRKTGGFKTGGGF
ncbi:hypothetical protein GCM10011321_32810 [Youhaiella tibetensis]|uniref:Uncharacterized protein n=1 Tax=Paradevosia tibetensis TaxID=1447062 RepID=A0A5B9DJB3_9HYPH|nr:hypothetical protein [Youhaiella tibetensis]QEE18769.1 hypothetical protein FNA67_00605 [Youhaiella tibetensis]GGF39357.1 hypothetical protein GCM10011321_32810 [Youhaiella tibetensis]